MDYQNLIYCISRDYVHDCELPSETKNRILGWIRSRSLKQLASCCSASEPALSRSARRDLMQIEAFFKKASAFTDEEQANSAAIESFFEGEKLCRIANKRLDYYYAKPDRLDRDLREWVDKTQQHVESVLGPFPSFLEGLLPSIRITAGAASTRSRRRSQPQMKLSLRPVCNRGTHRYLVPIAKSLGYKVKPVLTDCNRVEIVPKNWKTGRSIACEPEGSLPFQLAFDDYVKKRLKTRLGIDLSDQSRNRRLARESSVDDSLATIDLSMASDTLSYNTVAWLLPLEWFRYLCDVRSRRFSLKGTTGMYAKFSSMGNGATFALETLVFACACKAVGSKRFSVYGDDIIIETELVPSLTKLLAFLGFHINVDKSHFTGPFRESCGGNYYEGIDITPFYIRDIDKRKAVRCHLINGLAAICVPGGKLWGRLITLVREWSLPLVPFNDDSMSGVWIDPHTAYGLGLIKIRGGAKVPSFKAYKVREKFRPLYDSRALFLWHLMRMRDPRGKTELITSRYSTLEHKYVRKWVRWDYPSQAVPAHLYWWADAVTHKS